MTDENVTLTVNVDTTRGVTEVSCPRGIVKLGSSNSADVILTDPTVARMHAVIEAESADSIFLIDLGNDAGVKLNGKRVSKGRLHPGDIIEVGNSAAKISYMGARPTPRSETVRVERPVEQGRCIEQEGGYLHGRTWCGKAIGPSDYYIPDLGQYVKNIASGRARVRPCPHCVAAIKGLLDQAVDVTAKVA